MTIIIFAIIIGYLIGAISPAYFLARLIKKKDIRQLGDKNAGTTNVYHVLGLWPAVVTALFDLTKGLIAMLVAYYLGVSELVIYLAGLAAALGHIFPFYLKFRGGQGVATLTGILLYNLFILVKTEHLPVASLFILAIVSLVLLIITRKKDFLALVVVPGLLVVVFTNYQNSLTKTFTEIILSYIFILNIYLAYKTKLFDLKPETIRRILPWRTVMRPLAAVFPISYFYLDRDILLWILAIIASPFLLFDLVRLLSRKINLFFFTKNQKVLKKGEEKRFSSMTLFLVASFLVILIFSKPIAIAVLIFLIFGDVFAKFFGSEYGRIKIFGEKTLEGSLAFFTVSLLAAYLMSPYLDLSPSILIAGVIAATIAEALPLGVNDNFSIALFSAAVMFLVQKYF